MHLTSTFINDTKNLVQEITYSIATKVDMSIEKDQLFMNDASKRLHKINNSALRALANPHEAPKYLSNISHYVNRLTKLHKESAHLFTFDSENRLSNLKSMITKPLEQDDLPNRDAYPTRQNTRLRNMIQRSIYSVIDVNTKVISHQPQNEKEELALQTKAIFQLISIDFFLKIISERNIDIDISDLQMSKLEIAKFITGFLVNFRLSIEDSDIQNERNDLFLAGLGILRENKPFISEDQSLSLIESELMSTNGNITAKDQLEKFKVKHLGPYLKEMDKWFNTKPENLLENDEGILAKILEYPPVGLKNECNSCYRNASLQLLFSSRLFMYEHLLSRASERRRRNATPDQISLEQSKHKDNLYGIMKRQIYNYHYAQSGGSGYGLEVEDFYLVNTLIQSGLMPDLNEESRHVQQDVAAYLQALLTEVCGSTINYSVTYTSYVNNEPQTKQVHHQFPFLQVPITAENDLQKLINLAHETKTITDEKNPVNFEVDGKEISCTTYTYTTKIDGKAPDTLFVLVERRIFDPTLGNFIYNDLPIPIPDNGIFNLSQVFSSDDDISYNYMVIGFINYHNLNDLKGEEPIGHYTAVIKRETSKNQWFFANDEIINEISDEVASDMSNKAYVLLLQKVAISTSDSVTAEPVNKRQRTE